MIAYTTLGTNDLDKAAVFYDGLFQEMGIDRMMERDGMVVWGTNMSEPAFGVLRPFDGQPASVGNGTMIALALKDPEAVDKFHAKALELGGSDEGAPGPRGEMFYAGYFRDLDGNKINAFCMAKS